MKTKEEVKEFLESLYHERLTKKELEIKLQSFLNTTNKLSRGDDEYVDKDIDYSYLFTNGKYPFTRGSYTDVEIWYAKTRSGKLLITGTELLDYER